MPNPTTILQPTAEEILRLLSMSADDKTLSVKLTLEIEKKTKLTLKEAAKYIRRKEYTLRQYVKDGVIRSQKNGKAHEFDIAVLEEFLQTGGNC